MFIDAAGAGFSTILDKAKPELWSVDGDVKGFSAFIRAYLSKYRRWNSPKYVLGESTAPPAARRSPTVSSRMASR